MNYENSNQYKSRYVQLGAMTDKQQMPCCSGRDNTERSSWDIMMMRAMKDGTPIQLAPPSVIQGWNQPLKGPVYSPYGNRCN